MEQDRETTGSPGSPESSADEPRNDEAGKSSGGLTGGDTSLSGDGTTSGGLGSGANPGTGGDAGNWDQGGAGATDEDSSAGSEGKPITYPTGTSTAAVGDWSARQAGSGRESESNDPEAADPEE